MCVGGCVRVGGVIVEMQYRDFSAAAGGRRLSCQHFITVE